jgi:hypothetical protein
MNPAIVHPKGKPACSFLIDLQCTMHANEKGAKRSSHLALRAIDIRHLRAGEVEMIDGKIYPRPCQLVAAHEFEMKDPMWRGIFPDAAAALLSVPMLGIDLDIPRNSLNLAVPSSGWDQWPFLAAWGWSEWQTQHRQGERWTFRRRWEALRMLGYPHSEGAFRKMCAGLKLSVTGSAPNR